jgi:hypothetical protein
MLSRKFLHIQFLWKRAIIVNFNFLHRVIVEFEALQHNDKDVWKLFDAQTLQSSNFLFAGFTVISIITVKNLTFNESF